MAIRPCWSGISPSARSSRLRTYRAAWNRRHESARLARGMNVATIGRFTRLDWLTLGEQRLSADGPGALSLERLTQAAGRGKGSFWKHFQSPPFFLSAYRT